MQKDVYSREPIRFEGQIPVFFSSSEFTENYEKISEDHIAHMEKTGKNPFIREELWIELENSTKELILKYSNGGAVLDIGVGMGRLLSLLPSTFEKYGMDISNSYLKIAKTKNIEVCNSLIEDIPYKKGLFDIVICTDVLEHVLDLNLACQKILSVLKKGGYLIVRVPYREDLSRYLKPSYPYKYAHLRSFDEHSLIILFEKIFGCSVIEYHTAGHTVNRSLLKVKLPSFLKLLFCGAVYSTKFVTKIIYRLLLKMFFNPVEINVVIKKTPESAV